MKERLIGVVAYSLRNRWRNGPTALLVLAVFAVAGCGATDLGRVDREVRANWSALVTADRLNAEFVERLIAGRHPALVNQPRLRTELSSAIADIQRLHRTAHATRSLAGLPSNPQPFNQYAMAHRRLADGLRSMLASLHDGSSAIRTWRARGLIKECEWALLRAETAAANYNAAVRSYNHRIEGSFTFVSRALLYPGSGKFALLDAAGPDTAQRSRP